MSLYWSQWVPKFYNYNAIKWLRDDWKITVIRAVMAVDNGGYATNPISQPNIAYTLHYYADSHKQFLRNTAQTALNNGSALFVTEYGTTDASGEGVVNEVESKTWWAFLDQNKVSHANWSVSDIPQASSALIATGASANGGWPLSDIKQSGQLVRNELRSKNPLSTTEFATTGVTPVSCQSVAAVVRQISFTPLYNGQTSDPISFSVLNEMAPTTAPGPYTINLYTDNPTITLKAKQGNLQASYSYNWLDVCFNSGARRAAEFTEKLVVTVLGNPVANDYAEVEVQGAANQTLRLQMIDAGGRSVNTTTVESAGAVERARINLGRSSGVYLLRISTPTQHEVIKLVKP